MTGDTQARRAARAELMTRVFVVVLCLIVVVLAVTLLKIRDTQLEGTPTGKKLVAASDRILDCTEPTGTCYRESQQRTADAVGNIGAANILAVVCALQVPNSTPLSEALDQVTKCVADRLKESR